MKKKKLVALSLSIVIISAVAAAYAITRNSPAQTGTWQLFDQMSGTGNQDTTEFTINNQWRVVWSIENGSAYLFIVAVYAKNGNGFSLIAETDELDTNKTQGILRVDHTGSFVIRVVALSDTGWSFRVEEYFKQA